MAAVSAWRLLFHTDPLPLLFQATNPALLFHVQRDLLSTTAGDPRAIWDLPEPVRLIKQQQPNGSWRYRGKTSDAEFGSNHDLLETFRSLRFLVEMYAFDRRHPAIEKAADYVFTCQTPEGDIRGILANQYMPYYMGAILALLIQAGYADDDRTLKGLDWLLGMRQQDGAWMIPLQKYGTTGYYQYARSEPLPPDRSLPSSHLATGMVLRAFAAHSRCRQFAEVLAAAKWLKERLFKKDSYNDHQAVAYWTRFQYPFWWTDLLSTLTTLQQLGFPSRDPDIQSGLDWFIQNQSAHGMWMPCYEKKPEADLWVTLAVCRCFKNFFP